MSNVKLSIIIPCYNVANTLARAVDSILMQQVNFAYEIIIVDDASTDDSLKLISKYAQKNKQIKLIKHKKNQGNAISFYDALTLAKGDYFCVLDGDDFYTIKNKLQRQVDFLDDNHNKNYVAVTHHFLMMYSDGRIKLPDSAKNKQTEFDRIDFLSGAPYYHTSCYMYRNIFRGMNIDFFKEEILRGDTPRTFFCLYFSNKKVKVLNFFGSVYTISEKGIYQGISLRSRIEREIKLWSRFRDFFADQLERRLIDAQLKTLQDHVKKVSNEMPSLSGGVYKSNIIGHVYNEAFKFAYKEKNLMFNGFYKSDYLDSLCAAVGYCELVGLNWSPIKKRKLNNNKYLIVISSLNPNGGGIFSELTELFEMCSNKNITVLLTDVKKLDEDVLKKLKPYRNVRLVFANDFGNNKLRGIFEYIMNLAPSKTYFYIGHTNALAQTIMQPGLSHNINVVSYDHGFVLGTTNVNYDTFIVKRQVDYWILHDIHKDKVLYIPSWNKQVEINGKYKAFNNHKNLITACGAARFYKLETSYISYIDMVLNSLVVTHGKHIHYGVMPDYILEKVKSFLKEHKLSEDSFVNIPWTDNLQQSFIDNKVDIFLSPFPTISYKMTLNALAAGVPVFSYDGNTRLSVTDFIYKGNLLWKNEEDFVKKLKSFTADVLDEHSKRSLEYFNKNHAVDKLRPLFIKEQQLRTPDLYDVCDGNIIDVADCLNIWGNKLSEEPLCQQEKNLKNSQLSLTLKHRCKLMWYIVVAIIAQIPVVDLLIHKKIRAKLLNKIQKWWE